MPIRSQYHIPGQEHCTKDTLAWPFPCLGVEPPYLIDITAEKQWPEINALMLLPVELGVVVLRQPL